MFAKKSIFRIFPVLFMIVFILAQVDPVYAAPALFTGTVKTADAQSQLPLKVNGQSSGFALAVCPPSIGFGETVQCSIASPGEIDSYTFTANAGDKVLVRMSKSSGTLWPKIIVGGPGGTKLCETYSSETAEIASCTLASSGIHTITAYGYSGTDTGDYYLYLQRLNNPGSAVAIAFGQTLAGSIVTSAEMDSYTFTANAGDKVLVMMSKSTGTLWPKIRVYSPDGTKLCEAYSSVTTEIASCTLPSTGAYTILAYGYYGTDTGDYYLYLQRLNNPGSPVSIAFGQTLTGSIVTPAEMDTYTFTANAGDKVLVRMSKSSGILWPKMRVYGPDGTQLCEAYSSVTAEIASCTLTSNGTYTILAYGYYGTDTGDYYLYLQRLNNPGNPVSIAFGQTLTGSIVTLAEMDSYTFAASAGDKVLVRMSKSSGTLWPKIRVYSPDGIQLCEEYSSVTTEITSCTLTSNGTYTILAYGYYGTDTGDYYLYLQRLNNPGNPVSIAFGQTLTGSIITPAEMDSYTFTATAGDKVLVRMSKSSGTLWPKIRVYSPAGIQLCEEYSSVTTEIASCTLTSNGTYTILAYGYYGTDTGDYYLYLQRLNNPGSPVSIIFGQTLTGSIVTPAEMDSYTFTANAGDKVLVRMSKASGTLWPKIRVYSPDGAKLCEEYSSDTTEIASCTLPSTGTYTILAYGYYGTDTGDYSLYLQRLNNPSTPVFISGNAGIAGATLSYIDVISKTATADGSGNYSFAVPSNWTGTVTPSLTGYGFTPASRSYTNITVDQVDQNYTADVTTFTDVPPTYWAWSFIERLYNTSITGGCATTPSLMYCPEDVVTRAQMAVFLLRGVHGSSYTPPDVGTDTGFTDVAIDYWSAAWIKQLAAEGITGGCGTGIYCPDATVTRAQMAVFLLKAKHGISYSPPAATGVFIDVPVGYWADKWIEQLALEGITGGCGAGTYCPDSPVTRAQMAVFLVRAFSLP